MPAPGYQNDPVMAWDRPVDPSCLLCHASQLSHIYKTVNRYAETTVRTAWRRGANVVMEPAPTMSGHAQKWWCLRGSTASVEMMSAVNAI